MIPYCAVSGGPSSKQFKTNAEADDADNVKEKNEYADEWSAGVASGTVLMTPDERPRVFQPLEMLKWELRKECR